MELSRTLTRRLLSLRTTPRAFLCGQCRRHIATDSRTFAEGDIVLLRPTRDSYADGILTKPLSPSQTIHTHRGTLSHASILGKRVRQVITTSKGISYRLHEPTLAEYVRLTPRIVTPIYPADANLIVSLLDIHVTPPPSAGETPQEHDEPLLEILEAGTGHGALTLHLARAIQAANAPPPPLPPSTRTRQQQQQQTQGPSQASSTSDSSPGSPTSTTPPSSASASASASTSSDEAAADAAHDAYETWKRTRRAVLHTLDISSRHSSHARKVVKGFRRGLYSPHVDFHVGDVSEWVGGMLRARAAAGTATATATATATNTTAAADAATPDAGTEVPVPEPPSAAEEAVAEPFLTHVFLDLPSAHTHLGAVAQALRVDGVAMVFKPSITQIAECVRQIRDQGLPFQLERVVELGTGLSGGRVWDVRSVVPRAVGRMKDRGDSKGTSGRGDGRSEGEGRDEGYESERLAEDEEKAESEILAKDKEEGLKARDEEQVEEMRKRGDEWMMVCRPKVGEVIVGGGFLGVWRRTRDKASDRS